LLEIFDINHVGGVNIIACVSHAFFVF
jgi:hypothetical protein